MTIEDLASALRNAIDRGENLDRAVASLINAGYNSQEVNAARQTVLQMASSSPRKVLLNPLPLQTSPTQQIQLTQRPQLQQNFSKTLKSSLKGKSRKGKWLVIASISIISLLILLLIGILFAIILG